MESKKYKVVLNRSADFVDYSQQGSARYHARMNPGEYMAILANNPSGSTNDSKWLVFENTTIGATMKYFQSVAKIIALS